MNQRPRIEHVRGLAAVLRDIGKPDAVVFLALVLYDAPWRLVCEQLQISLDRFNISWARTMSRLRHPSHSGPLRDLLLDLDGPRPTILIDDELRALIREWRLEEMFEPRCALCGHPMDVPLPNQERRGRPRKYCSDACKQKAYRLRTKSK